MESNTMYIQDENGNEIEMTILFTFENNQKKYVVFKNVESTDDEVFASAYTDEGELTPVETDAEWNMIEEVLQAFAEEEDE